MTSPQPDERRAKALELHLAGATYDAIAQSLGYASRSGAHKAVQEALDGLGKPPSQGEVRDTELARLDAMLTGLWPKARRGDVQAIDRVLKISAERRALLTELGWSSETKGSPLDEFTARRQGRDGAGSADPDAARSTRERTAARRRR